MKSIIATVLFLAMVCTAMATKEMKTAECTFDTAALCVTEIGTAFDSCQDWTTPEEILGCMEQIIGASDCWDCVCVVLDFLPFCA